MMEIRILKVIGIWMIPHFVVPVRGKESQKSEVDVQERETIEVSLQIVLSINSSVTDGMSSWIPETSNPA